MKVRELIEELKKLNQEKDIWIAFEGGYEYGKPLPYGIANEDDKEVKRGDYLIGDYWIINKPETTSKQNESKKCYHINNDLPCRLTKK